MGVCVFRGALSSLRVSNLVCGAISVFAKSLLNPNPHPSTAPIHTSASDPTRVCGEWMWSFIRMTDQWKPQGSLGFKLKVFLLSPPLPISQSLGGRPFGIRAPYCSKPSGLVSKVALISDNNRNNAAFRPVSWMWVSMCVWRLLTLSHHK